MTKLIEFLSTRTEFTTEIFFLCVVVHCVVYVWMIKFLFGNHFILDDRRRWRWKEDDKNDLLLAKYGHEHPPEEISHRFHCRYMSGHYYGLKERYVYLAKAMGLTAALTNAWNWQIFTPIVFLYLFFVIMKKWIVPFCRGVVEYNMHNIRRIKNGW